jgi:DNA (cytosine-5)-methyltransferase 1
MRYLSVCSGIEAATVAWKPLGWTALAFAEIDAFPRAVLKHHYPDTPLHGDFTQIRGDEHGPVDLLVGGTPCQSFSVAGLRGGLADDRGNLALEFLRLAQRTRARWVVWENVPGVLSSEGGRDFGAILGGLVELGYGFAYRVLDAQHFGVPQRRRRVFVVGNLGDWRRAAAVLFERHSLSGDTAPRREAREGVADFAPHGAGEQGGDTGRTAHWGATAQAFGGGANCHPTDVATAVAAHPGGRYDIDCETFVTHSLRGEGFDASEDGTGRGTPLVPVAFALRGRNGGAMPEVCADGNASALRAASGGSSRDYVATVANPVRTNYCNNSNPATEAAMHIQQGSAVRRLTPRECERLQGFPDDYTLIPWRKGMAPDGPRYKALGNSMAVPVMRWIGERIALAEALEQRVAA